MIVRSYHMLLYRNAYVHVRITLPYACLFVKSVHRIDAVTSFFHIEPLFLVESKWDSLLRPRSGGVFKHTAGCKIIHCFVFLN